MTKTIYKVHLMNVRSIGTRCGYGEGYTHAQALEDALQQARKIDPNAQYDAQSGCVNFNGGTTSL